MAVKLGNMRKGWLRATASQKTFFVGMLLIGLFLAMFLITTFGSKRTKDKMEQGKASSTYASSSAKITDQTKVVATESYAKLHTQGLRDEQRESEERGETYAAPPTLYAIDSDEDVNYYNEKQASRRDKYNRKNNTKSAVQGFSNADEDNDMGGAEYESGNNDNNTSKELSGTNRGNNSGADNNKEVHLMGGRMALLYGMPGMGNMSEQEIELYQSAIQKKMALYSNLETYWNSSINSGSPIAISPIESKKDISKDEERVINKTGLGGMGISSGKNNNRSGLEGTGLQPSSEGMERNQLNAGDVLLAVTMSDIDSDKPAPVSLKIIQGRLRGAVIDAQFNLVNNRYLAITTKSISYKKYSKEFMALVVDPVSRGVDIPGSSVDNHYISRWLAGSSAFLLKGFGDAIGRMGTTTTNQNTTVTTATFNTTQLALLAASDLVEQLDQPLRAIINRKITISLPRGTRVGLRMLGPFNAGWVPVLRKGRDYR